MAVVDSQGDESTLPTTEIHSDEFLFRSVNDSVECHRSDANGALLELGHSAFNDPKRQPSVDRRSLRADVPADSRRAPEAGVVTLVAGEVRSIRSVRTFDPKGKTVVHEHEVDVLHRPVAGNYSHAQIEGSPHPDASGAWKKLKEALCQLAKARGWSFPPASAR